MSIPNKDAPADRQSRPQSNQQLQRREGGADWPTACALQQGGSSHRNTCENNHCEYTHSFHATVLFTVGRADDSESLKARASHNHINVDDNNALSMRPPPLPSPSSHYSSRSEAPQPTASTQLPSIRAAFSSEAYSSGGRVYGEERIGIDQTYEHFSAQPASTHTHRSTPSQSDYTAYGHNGHHTSSVDRPPSMSDHEGSQQLSELRTGPSAPPPMLTGLPRHSTENRYVFLPPCLRDLT